VRLETGRQADRIRGRTEQIGATGTRRQTAFERFVNSTSVTLADSRGADGAARFAGRNVPGGHKAPIVVVT